jgi:hypothetical protein
MPSTRPIGQTLAAAIPLVDREVQEPADHFLEQVRAIREAHGPLIVATGVSYGGEYVVPLVDARGLVAESNAALTAFARRLEAAGITTKIPAPFMGGGEPDPTAPFEDVVFDIAIEYGMTGYLLGVAVGTLLGPHALTTARQPRRLARIGVQKG